MAVVEPATRRLHGLIAGRFDARWFGRFLREVAAAYPGERVILVVDNAGWHRARALAVSANVILWFLPPHCPEANPAEQIWQWLRDHHTRGELFRDRAALPRRPLPRAGRADGRPGAGALAHRPRRAAARCKTFLKTV